ncbi:MAG: DUF4912 domain-containing protein [Nitrospinae bacterium]|jgi:uncharacterized protein|nr:DUF4912 domain-containing protein [Nitrospinota bacterium]MDA1110852.1 DUF4912 domain-containing protein [Nitrospinota bacterium]
MTTPDLSKMTKDELIRLAAKNKISVKKTLLKSEIVAVLKKEMKKASKTDAPKKAPLKTKTEPSRKPPAKSGAVAAKPTKKTEAPATAAKPTAKNATVKTKGKEVTKKTASIPKPKAEAKTTTAPSTTAPTRKKKTPALRKKSARPSSSPSGQQAIPGSGTQALHPKFKLEDGAQEANFILGKPDMHDESHQEVYQELPANYGDNKLVLLVRDPHWCFLYWELQSDKIEAGLGRLNRSENAVRHVLRIHSPSGGGTYFDADIDFRAGSHYIQLSPPGASFYSEIGLLDQEGHFAALAVSNTVTLPLDGPSEIIDEQWMTTNENFEEIYMLSGGRMAGDRAGEGLIPLGASEALQRTRSEQRRMDFSSPAVSSFGSGENRNPPERSFNYWLDAELVLFGGADPGATIKLSGKNLDLRPDGTFSTRFILPEGTLNLPVNFESPDRSEVHTVAPIINRKTVDNVQEVEQ